MEESNLINNDNTYNTDMSTSQSTIGGNSITNNTLNKDDLQEVTGGGGGGIVTPPTTIVDGSETSQTTGSLTPILLILGDGTSTPDVEEEPVLLEEDSETTYNAVINSEYEDKVPTITLKSNQQSYSNSNYVIAVTETDKTIPVSYDSTNLSVSFTNNGNNWCRVTFIKNPLNFTFTEPKDLTLNSDNFPSNSNIIVPVISCEENNTGQERNTTITFNIKNFDISHNIQMNVIQEKIESAVVPDKALTPVILYIETTDIFKIYTGNIYIYYNSSYQQSHLVFGTTDGNNVLYFGLKDKNNNINNNITNDLTWYINKFSFNFSDVSINLMYNNIGSKEGTSATILLSIKQKEDRTIKVKYDNIPFCDIIQKYKES